MSSYSCRLRGLLILWQKVLLHTRHAVFVRSMINGRGRFEISMARRRRNGPFERIRFPWIIWCLFPFEDAVNKIDQKRDGRKPETKCADGDKDIDRLRAPQVIVQRRIRDPAHHSVQSKIVHREKGAVEENEGETEM